MIEWTSSRYNDFLCFQIYIETFTEVSGGALKIYHVSQDQHKMNHSPRRGSMIYPTNESVSEIIRRTIW